MKRSVSVLWLGILIMTVSSLVPALTVSPQTLPVSRPEWRAGDSWTWIINGDAKKRSTWTVTAVKSFQGGDAYEVSTGKRLEYFNKDLGAIGSFDPNGQPILMNDPPLKWYDWPLAPGKKWSQSVRWENYQNHTSGIADQWFTVKKQETIKVPAGEFETIKIVRETAGTSWDEYWYCPEVKNFVKWVSHRSGGTTVSELTEYSASGASKP